MAAAIDHDDQHTRRTSAVAREKLDEVRYCSLTQVNAVLGNGHSGQLSGSFVQLRVAMDTRFWR